MAAHKIVRNTKQKANEADLEALKDFGWDLLLVDEDGFPLRMTADEEADAEKQRHLPLQID